MKIPEATGRWVIVDPLYEAAHVFSHGVDLIMPKSARNPMAQQGTVVSVGPHQKDIDVGDHVLVHPFAGIPFKHGTDELLVFSPGHVAGFIRGEDVYPLPGFVLILPSFPEPGHVKKGTLYIVQEVFDDFMPKLIGTILRRGAGVTTVAAGHRVIFPPNRGHEIGFDNGKIRQVYYAIHEADLEAILK